MSFLKSIASYNYQQVIMGTFGCFKTSAGTVNFLESKAKITNNPDGSNESRLTQYLRPVREALPVSEMNFNQLLQRDLDDHRVAVELVPYLLTPRNEGPAFFPPVVACLLPFSNRQPIDAFPARSDPKFIEDIGLWKSTEYGHAFRFDQLYEHQQKEHIAKLGRVSWNAEAAELVIIDGQHRAMALLAIDRTINNRWDGLSAKYAAFYEPVVKRCLEKYTDDEIKSIFESVELPVTVIWFPEQPSIGSHHKAARKVFVDLNKNARPPSPSRLMLLSDGDLVSIFTRELLNEMRIDGAGYPIYGVEYDNPSRDQASSAKWSTLTNISCIFESVRRLCCGPDKYFTDMDSSFQGRDNETIMRITLRESLDLKNALPENITDDKTYSRDDIDWANFPSSKVEIITKQFSNGWGKILSKFYSSSLPFSTHSAALRQLVTSWIPGGVAASALAKEAVFEGVGLYWTIRDSESHWREENQRRIDEGDQKLHGNDVVDAWGVIENKKVEFSKIRSKLYLGSEAKAVDADDAFQIFSTAACQVGFVLAVRAIGKKLSIESSQVEKFSVILMQALNAGLNERRLFVSKTSERSINFLPRLDPSYSVYFRYFWLELFNSPESLAVFKANGLSQSFSNLLVVGFNHYRNFIIKVNAKKYRDADPDLSEPESIIKATKELDKRFKKRLLTVFSISAEEYNQRIDSQLGTPQELTPGSGAATDVDEDTQRIAEITPSAIELEVQELDRMLRGSDLG